MSAEFGQLIRAAMQDQDLSQGKVAALVGLYDGDRYLDATQVRLLMNGTRKPTRGLVQRLVDVLGIDEAEAYFAAGIWPPDLDIQSYRRFRQHALAGVSPTALTRQSVKHQAQVRELDNLIPFPVERRRHDRRARPQPMVPEAAVGR